MTPDFCCNGMRMPEGQQFCEYAHVIDHEREQNSSKAVVQMNVEKGVRRLPRCLQEAVLKEAIRQGSNHEPKP